MTMYVDPVVTGMATTNIIYRRSTAMPRILLAHGANGLNSQTLVQIHTILRRITFYHSVNLRSTWAIVGNDTIS